MGNIKTVIKNDLWKWNYILPFVKKHQFDEKGKVDVAKHVFHAYQTIRPVKAGGKRTIGNDTKALLERVNIAIDNSNRFVYFIDTEKTIAVSGNILSNFTLDYDRVVHGSFQQLVEKAIGPDDYGKEAQAAAEGVKKLAERICDAIEKSDLPQQIKESRLSNFRNILTSPAEHFEEALQRILFFNQIMWQTRHRLNGLGRLDKMLDDLYTHDIEIGCLSDQQAAEMIHDFLSQLSRYKNYKSDALEGDIGQIIILGGLDPDGSYFCNRLTEIFLTEQAKLGKPDPKTLIRVSRKMPDSLLQLAVNCLLSKTGSPLFSNDDRVVPSLIDFGMPAEDAYSYCTSACWEPYIVGKSLDQNNIAVFDFFEAFEEVLNAADSIADFEDLVNQYIEVNRKKFCDFLGSLDQMKWAKDPLVSMFMEGCSEKRQDVSEGAAVYNNYGVTTVALSNVVDSLLVLKEKVFDSGKYTVQTLNKARCKNFLNCDELYQELNEQKRFYGHDEELTILLVERITESMAEAAQKYRNVYGGTVKFGLSSPGYNILCKKTGADLTGRKSGMPYNTHISCMDAIYTEVVNFAARLSYDKQRFNGNVVDFFVAPSFLADHIDKFTLFMKGAILSGFFQMQMNIMDSNTLIDAKAHPEKYTGLIVRVWGFSAYFNDLPESYKDMLIERALRAERVHD